MSLPLIFFFPKVELADSGIYNFKLLNFGTSKLTFRGTISSQSDVKTLDSCFKQIKTGVLVKSSLASPKAL